MTTPTPETDRAVITSWPTQWGAYDGKQWVPADHARQLERERDQLRAEVVMLREAIAEGIDAVGDADTQSGIKALTKALAATAREEGE